MMSSNRACIGGCGGTGELPCGPCPVCNPVNVVPNCGGRMIEEAFPGLLIGDDYDSNPFMEEEGEE